MRQHQRPFAAVLRRRMFLGAGGSVVASSLAGCGLFSTDPANDGRKSVSADGGKPSEAPMLADLVESGKLPPLQERLPEAPLVVEPVDRAGIYGGTWRSALLGPADQAVLIRNIGYDPLLTWDREFTEPMPNIAREFEIAADGREFVFHLRPGMKWSDGEPFTAEDIVFACDDMFGNENLFPTVPDWLVAGGEPATVDALDDVTIRFTFVEPSGLFLARLAEPSAIDLVGHPRHYLEQFHPDYNPDAEEQATDEGYADWMEHFTARASRWANSDLPTSCAWRVTEPLGDSARVVAERNPYYWKTDPDGAQLPYLDEVVFDVVQDEQVMLLKATNGELDMHARHFNTPQNKPLLAESRDGGGYEFFDLIGPPNDMALFLNLTHQDDALREVFASKDFRIGLSYAINREEIINAVYQRQGEPWQLAPRPESPLFDEEMAKQYTDYDVDLANEHLDRAGFTERDGQGFRQGPGGERISFRVDIPAGQFPNFPPALELIAEYWNEVGVQMRPEVIDRSLYVERRDSNQHDANVWGGGGDAPTTLSAILAPPLYFPSTMDSSYAIPWVNWYLSDGADGEEPAEPAQRQMALYDQLRTSMDSAEQEELMRQIVQIAKEEFYAIGLVQLPPGYGIVMTNFHNVPDSMPDTWRWPTPGPTRTEQYFIED